MADIWPLIGFVGALLMNVKTGLQVVKTYSSKRVEGVSVAYFISAASGLTLLGAYAWHIGDDVFLISSIVGVALNIAVLNGLFKYRKVLK